MTAHAHDHRPATRAETSADIAPQRPLLDLLGPGGLASAAQADELRAIQMKGDGDGEAIHEAAAHGIAGSGGPLPHGERIQAAFGRHDVSDVQAHVGGAAAEAAMLMNAQAYATGRSVAFAETPDLHTAAHEAAHVVQQRGGVSLKGGVGQAGDTHERHADAVADAVVAGRSAEGLLDRYAGAGGAPAVQRQEAEPSPETTSGDATEGETPTPVADDASTPAEHFVRDLPGDMGLVTRLAEADPDALGRIHRALAQHPDLVSPALVDALLGLALGAAPAAFAIACGGSPWLSLYAEHLGDAMRARPVLALGLVRVDRNGIEGMASTAQLAPAYHMLGRTDLLSVRDVALDALTGEGALDPATVVRVDTMLLSGEADALLRDAEAFIGDIQTSIAEATSGFYGAIEAMSTPPTADEMLGAHDRLTAFEAQLADWRGLAMRFDDSVTRWTLAAAAGARGVDFEAMASTFTAGFRDAVRLLHAATDSYNRTEIEREHALASPTRPVRERLRIDDRPQPEDRDWLPMHVPGIVVERHSLRGRAGRPRGARLPDEIGSAVIHTGGRTAAGTVDTLQGRGLAGHYAIGLGGETEQMYPASQRGAHAGVANRSSIAIDLAYGDRVDSRECQVAFLGSLRQLVATARILLTHDRISPEVIGRPNARGAMLGRQIPYARHMEGAFSGVADFGGSSDAEAEVSGVVAHQDLPDSDHGDPGALYMHRLYTLLPLLEAYEARYGPIRLSDDTELERVMMVIERYEETTGRPAGALSETELWEKVEARVGPVDEADPETLRRAIDAVFDEMVGALARAHHGDDWSAALDAARTRVDEHLGAANIRFEGTVAEWAFLRNHLRLPGGTRREAWLGNPAHAARLGAARRTAAYTEARDRHRNRVRHTLARQIVVDEAYVAEAGSRIEQFRAYLQAHLPDLLGGTP